MWAVISKEKHLTVWFFDLDSDGGSRQGGAGQELALSDNAPTDAHVP